MVPYWDLRILNAGEICDIGIETTCDSLEVSRMAPGRNAYQTLNWRVTPLKHSFLLAMFFFRKDMTKLFRSERFYTKYALNSWKRSTSLLVLRRKQNLGAEQMKPLTMKSHTAWV
jgi:NAD+ kinase